MVFLALNEPLEMFLQRDIETRRSDVDWLLFDNYIKDKSLNKREIFKSDGYLAAYMDRCFWYPMYYEMPMYCYLFSGKEFRKINFFSEDEKNIACSWNMKRVPEYTDSEEKYPRITQLDMVFGYGEYKQTKEYIRKKFEELVSVDLTKVPYACVVLGEESIN